MHGILELRERGMFAVGSENVLGEVVCSDTEELSLFRELLCQKCSGRDLDHRAYLHRPEVRLLFSLELGMCVFE